MGQLGPIQILPLPKFLIRVFDVSFGWPPRNNKSDCNRYSPMMMLLWNVCNSKVIMASDLISFRRKSNHVSEVLQPWRVFNKNQVQTTVRQVRTGRQTFRTLGACAGDVRSDHTDEAPFDGMPTWNDIYDEDFLSGTKLISDKKNLKIIIH